MKTEEDYELIDKYLSGALSENETFDFDQKLKTDSEFSLKVKRQELANQLLVEQRLLNAKDFISSYKHSSGLSSSQKWLIAIGSSLFLFSAIGYVYLKNEPKESTPVKTQEKVIENNQKEIIKDRDTSGNLAKGKPESNIVPIPENNTSIKEQKSVLPEPVSKPENKVEVPFNAHKASSKVAEKALSNQNLHEATQQPNPCVEKIQANIFPYASCKEQATGILDIRNIMGGKSPYSFSIDGGKTFAVKSTFNFLEGRSYTVILKDGNSCLSDISVVHIDSKNCDKAKESIFNPSVGEVWNFPMGDKKIAKVSIMNREGKLVYQAVHLSSHQESWNGKDASGNYSEVGLHYYIIEFEDGTVKDGYVTVVL